MIVPPGQSQVHWQSPDGLMAAGNAQLNGWSYGYASLGPRLLIKEDILGLIHFFQQHPPGQPLVLISNCPGFALSLQAESEGMVFHAGQYRALQQIHKAHGGLIVSYLEEIAVGGVYLMHGLSAQHRAAREGTIFYDTVPSRPPVSLAQAQERGLLDKVLPFGGLESWLIYLFTQLSLQAEP